MNLNWLIFSVKIEFTCVKTKVANINFVEIIITFINRSIHPDRGDTISVRIFLGLTHLKSCNKSTLTALYPTITMTLTIIQDKRQINHS